MLQLKDEIIDKVGTKQVNFQQNHTLPEKQKLIDELISAQTKREGFQTATSFLIWSEMWVAMVIIIFSM